MTLAYGTVHDVGVDEELLTIGVFARRSRLSLRALRLYDRLGLLSPAVVDPDNGYRRYRPDQLFTARLIVSLRRLDMPLSEVARVLTAAGAAGAEVVGAYWMGVEHRVESQRQLAERLQESLRGGQSRPAVFVVQEREAPEVVVLYEKRSVDLPELRPTIIGALGRLTRSADDHGGTVGGPMILFHGEVNEDSDGPIEICVPVMRASQATRKEPAHQEAYVTVTRAQWEWPQILSVYDAVEEWIEQRGRTSIGPPREIYHRGFNPILVTPDDEVCDIAFPIV